MHTDGLHTLWLDKIYCEQYVIMYTSYVTICI